MGNKYLDTKLIDKAIKFAVNKHENQERNGKGSPYVLHVLEAATIVETITNDPEMIAAAVLHDTIEDTDTTYEELSNEFGERVAKLVSAETSVSSEGLSDAGSWEERKQKTISKLKNASREEKIVALGDKLSNARVMYRDYYELGDELWNKFHVNDVRKHEWYYRSLVSSLSELEDIPAYIDFRNTVNRLFLKAVKEVEMSIEGSDIVVSGHLRESDVSAIKSLIKEKDIEYRLDFEKVGYVSLSAIRKLIELREDGFRFYITNLESSIYTRFAESGALNRISILEAPKHLVMSDLKLLGGGYNGESYVSKSGETLVKLYMKCADIRLAENEKRCSEKVFNLGVKTPISGSLVEVDGRIGICYEIVKGKKSIARALSDEPSMVSELAKIYSDIVKELHRTPCDMEFFPSIKAKYIREIKKVDFLKPDDLKKVLDFIDKIEDQNICCHGDLQIGNVIMANGRTSLIDLGDFAWGNPEFDLATLYFIKEYVEEEVIEDLYHISRDLMRKFYDAFEKEYYGFKPDEERLKKMAAIRGLTYASLVGKNPGILKSLEVGFNIKID